MKFEVVKIFEDFNQSQKIYSIFHIEDNNLVCMTIKNDVFLLVFMDITLENPYNGEIYANFNQNEDVVYPYLGRNFARGKGNTFLFSMYESVLVIDY